MPETASDKIVDKIVEICRDVKDKSWQGQLKALWKVFNIMTAFIKGQANLLSQMDAEIKRQGREITALKKELAQIKLPAKEPVKPLAN